MGLGNFAPIMKEIMQYKRDDNGDDRDEDEIVNAVMKNYGADKHKYLRFMLFPEIYDPIRPPTMFPYPTHLFRDVGSLPLTAANGTLYIAWEPFGRDVNTNSIRSNIVTFNGASTYTASGTDLISKYACSITTSVIPTITGIDQYHARGIAAYVQLTYLGSLDHLAGVIEVGLTVEDYVSPTSAGIRYVPQTGFKSLYQYQRFDVSKGCRCIWFPVKSVDFDFIGSNNVGGPMLNPTYYIAVSGAPVDAAAFRLDFGYWYDGIVDETGYNVLLPQKTPRDGGTNNAIVQTVGNNIDKVAITQADPTSGGLASSVWGAVKDEFSNAIGYGSKLLFNEGIDLMRNPALFLK